MGQHQCCQVWAKPRKEQTLLLHVPEKAQCQPSPPMSCPVMTLLGEKYTIFVARITSDLGTMKLNWQVPPNVRTNKTERHTPSGSNNL